MEFLNQTRFFQNSLWEYCLALASFIVVLSSLQILKRLFQARLTGKNHYLKEDLQHFILQMLNKTYLSSLLAVSLHIGASFLSFSAKAEHRFDVVIAAAIFIQFIFWGHQLIEFGLQKLIRKREASNGGQDPAISTIVPTARFLFRVLLYVTVLLVALDNLGVNISALLAGLGVGGIAVALAVQNILGDLFASLSIVLDKPFEVGDSIQVGEALGEVQRIGLKTTRLKSLTGEQLIFANSQLLSSQIKNFKRMAERRQAITLGLVYNTPIEKLKLIPQILQGCVEAQGNRARFDRAQFTGFSASSLDFEYVYFSQHPEMRESLATQENINFAILEAFKKEGIEFAYPTQQIILQKL